MKKSGKISIALRAVKLFSVGLMFSCLLLLTGINFIIYSSSHQIAWEKVTDNEKPCEDANPGPVEEKSANSNLNIQEEYVHEYHLQSNFLALDILNHHRIIEAGKLCIVHFELISPPPEA